MPSNDIILGMAERAAYGVILAGGMKFVEKGYISSDMAAYVAGGGMAAVGSIYAWWRNRPGQLLDRAAAQIPKSAKLVITTGQDASRQDKNDIHDLAESAGEKVTAKVTI